MIQFTLTLTMTTKQVVETSVTVIHSPIQDYNHLDDHAPPTYEVSLLPFAWFSWHMYQPMNHAWVLIYPVFPLIWSGSRCLSSNTIWLVTYKNFKIKRTRWLSEAVAVQYRVQVTAQNGVSQMKSPDIHKPLIKTKRFGHHIPGRPTLLWDHNSNMLSNRW